MKYIAIYQASPQIPSKLTAPHTKHITKNWDKGFEGSKRKETKTDPTKPPNIISFILTIGFLTKINIIFIHIFNHIYLHLERFCGTTDSPSQFYTPR